MLNTLPSSQWNKEKAAHLLRRAGFGGTAEQIDELVSMNLKEAVRKLVYWQDQPEYGQAPSWTSAQALEKRKEERIEARQLPQAQREDRQRQLRRQLNRQARELKGWWLDRMINSTRPLEEKMTLFWHSHFVSSASKVRDGVTLWNQHEIFRRQGNGNFKDLTVAVGRDPAMLLYLDGNQSKQGAPNENYARELMELFTLGEGNYTETDIQESARAHTGWRVDRLSSKAIFVKYNYDSGLKKFRGKSGKFNDEDIVEIILDDDQCARYIGSKIWTFFVSDVTNEKMAGYLGRTLKANDYDISALLERLFTSEEFYADSVIGQQIKSPVDWYISLTKSLPLRFTPKQLAPQILSQLGQDLYNPPSVKGWDGGKNWINTSTLNTWWVIKVLTELA
ncbi:MAG: DUF1800 domain-containing protein [Verrucomicrobiota bacterium]